MGACDKHAADHLLRFFFLLFLNGEMASKLLHLVIRSQRFLQLGGTPAAKLSLSGAAAAPFSLSPSRLTSPVDGGLMFF
jgi:hypothetical protein